VLVVFFVFFLLFYVFLRFLFFYTFYFNRLVVEFFLFEISNVDFSFTFVFDYLSLGFFGCVSFISGIVFFYRIFYIAGGKELRRFS